MDSRTKVVLARKIEKQGLGSTPGVGDLEQQLANEKVAKETLLASVERALVGDTMEETCSELRLVRLVHDI